MIANNEFSINIEIAASAKERILSPPWLQPGNDVFSIQRGESP